MGQLKRLRDLRGQRFGKLVVCDTPHEKKGTHTMWLVQCDCGSPPRRMQSCNLSTGASRSCGCVSAQRMAQAAKTHGQSGTSAYNSWAAMIQRCTNKTLPDYEEWGGRGITVCARWRHSFENFIQDMGPKPEGKYSIDRRDNDRGYEPSNCRWATDVEQANNRRPRRWQKRPHDLATPPNVERDKVA